MSDEKSREERASALQRIIEDRYIYNYIEKKDYRNIATFKEFLEEIKYFNLLRQAGYNESHFGALHKKANEKYKNMKLDD
jgi:hypothetical protein